MLGEPVGDLAPVLLHQHCHRDHQRAAGVVEDVAGSFDYERSPWRPVLEVAHSGNPGVMSMSVSPTFSASNTRESGTSCCRRALVVVLPAPWVPLSQMITGSDATGLGRAECACNDPHSHADERPASHSCPVAGSGGRGRTGSTGRSREACRSAARSGLRRALVKVRSCRHPSAHADGRMVPAVCGARSSV